MTQTSTKQPTTQDSGPDVLRIQLKAYQAPKIKEDKKKNLVWFGEQNAYPDKLVEYYNESPTHNAIVNGKIGYICGDGLTYKSDSPLQEMKVANWLKNANDSETWDQLLKKIVTDYEIHNGYALEVIRHAGKKYYYHLDFAKLRRAHNANVILYSEEWTKKDYEDNHKANRKPEYIEFELYDPEDPFQERSIIYHADYRPNMDWYPLPIYQGSLAAIETDVEINNWHLNEIKNGFSAGTMVTFNNGVPKTKEKKIEVEKKFRKKTTGSERAGLAVINFAANKEHAPQIDSLTGNDLDKRYEQLAKDVQQNIFIGHRVTSPMLFGVKTEGQLGGRDEISTSYEMMKKTYVVERQATPLKTINRLCKADTGASGVSIIDLEPVDNKLVLSEATIAANLSREEIRKLIAMQTGLELEQETEGEMTPSQNFGVAQEMEDRILEHLKKSGRPEDQYEVIENNEIQYNYKGEPVEIDLALNLPTLNLEILGLIDTNGKMSMADMATALATNIITINSAINELQQMNLISKGTGLTWKLLNAGALTLRILKQQRPEARTELKIMYKYQLRPDAPPLKGESRPFCQHLMGMNKLWSRQEIDLLRNDMKQDFSNAANVWLARGGWYRRPGTDISVPFCRHTWRQVVVKGK